MFKGYVVFALLILFGFQSQADWVCENGSIEEVGDSHFQISLLSDGGIEFSPYESGFGFEASEVNADYHTFTIVNKFTVMFTEGEAEEVLINAMMTFDAEQSLLYVALSYDLGPYYSAELSCEYVEN